VLQGIGVAVAASFSFYPLKFMAKVDYPRLSSNATLIALIYSCHTRQIPLAIEPPNWLTLWTAP